MPGSGRGMTREGQRQFSMFDSLSERLSGILDRLTRRGALTEADVDTALREVRRALIETLGSDSQSIDLNAPAPVPIMLVGLQGSGKTTTAAKLAKRLAETARRKVLMASLDVRRPAAMEQLAVLGQQVAVDTLPIVVGQQPVQIARRALEAGRLGGYDVVILDTAG